MKSIRSRGTRGSGSSRSSRGGGAGDLGQLTSVVLKAFEAWKFGARDDNYDPLMELARRDVHRLIVAYEEAADVNAGNDFLDELTHLIGNADEVRKSFVAWTALIEGLIHIAEDEYGTESGRGQIKKSQVKGAIIKLLIDTPNLKLPVPAYLQPFVIEAAVDWAIDSLVLTLNQHRHLWNVSTRTPKRPPVHRMIDRIVAGVVDANPFVHIALWLQKLATAWVLHSNPLLPKIDAEVKRVELSEGVGIQRSLEKLSEFVDWLAAHQKQAMAIAVLVSTAVEEAEQFLAMRSGAKKKEYARDLVLAFLEWAGIISSEDSLMYYLADGMIDWFIDAIVNIFNTRDDVFKRNKRLAPRR